MLFIRHAIILATSDATSDKPTSIVNPTLNQVLLFSKVYLGLSLKNILEKPAIFEYMF